MALSERGSAVGGRVDRRPAGGGGASGPGDAVLGRGTGGRVGAGGGAAAAAGAGADMAGVGSSGYVIMAWRRGLAARRRRC